MALERGSVAVLFSCIVLLGPADASPSTSPAPGWKPYRASPSDAAPGTRCPFALSGRIVVDRERIRTVTSFPDGSPQRQRVVGRLVVRYVNRAARRSVKRDLTGDAFIDAGADGSTELTLRHGRFAVGLGPSDPGGPAFLVLGGRGHSLRIAADGSRTLTLGSGRVENLCRTLASSGTH